MGRIGPDVEKAARKEPQHMAQEARDITDGGFIFDAQAWARMQTSIYDTMRSGGPPLLFEMGKNYGMWIGRKLSRAARIETETMRLLGAYFSSARLGELLIEVGPDDRETQVSVRGSPLTPVVRGRLVGQGSCHFLSGLLAGIFGEVYDWPFSVAEKKCRLVEGEHCVFLLRQREEFTSSEKKWGLSVLFPALYPWRME